MFSHWDPITPGRKRRAIKVLKEEYRCLCVECVVLLVRHSSNLCHDSNVVFGFKGLLFLGVLTKSANLPIPLTEEKRKEKKGL